MKKIILDKELEKQICDYYLDNHSLRETSSFFNLNRDIIRRALDANNISLRAKEETKKLEINNRIKNCREKYGVDFFMQTQEFKDKSIKTNQEKYGVDWQISSEAVQQKINNTKLKKYNNKNYNNRLCASDTCLKKYGAPSYVQSEQFKTKAVQTLKKNYDCTNYWSSNDWKEKYQKNKVEIKEKEYKAKRENKTFNTSMPEERYYDYLIKKYGASDVLRQYKDDRYPFACDFYIKSKDIFIELNISWTHGGHRFNPNSEMDAYKLNRWKEKAKESEYYKNAIKVWTELDPLKFETAQKNNLTYIVYYSENELYE